MTASDTRRDGRRRGGRSRRGDGGRERRMVPAADFRSYYDRPVVKPAPWEADIPAYLFLGGLAGGSSLLAAGADLTGQPSLRRSARVAALAAVGAGTAALVHDLGRPERFHHMLRVAKYTSPMSVGSWLLAAYGPMAGLAAASEAGVLVTAADRAAVAARVGRGAGLAAAALAPALASYTAVLLSDTATPAWHDARRHLPFVFVGGAAAAAGGLAMATVPAAEASAARRLAVGGALLDLAATTRMERAMGLTAEPMREGTAGRYLRAARVLTAGGAALAAARGRSSRGAAVLAGAALLAGSACVRFGVFHAGQQSARDPRYTVLPQRRRLDAAAAAGPPGPGPTGVPPPVSG